MLVPNSCLNLVSQSSKTNNTPQLFNASLTLCRDIYIHFMEKLRILQPLNSLENKLQENILASRNSSLLIICLKRYIFEITVKKKPANQARRRRHKISFHKNGFIPYQRRLRMERGPTVSFSARETARSQEQGHGAPGCPAQLLALPQRTDFQFSARGYTSYEEMLL